MHHHSIGYDRSEAVSRIRGLSVQNIQQDPNGPRLLEVIDDSLIAASRRVPIHFNVALPADERLEATVERLAEGRFIIDLRGRTAAEARSLVERVRRHCRFPGS